MSDTSDFLTVNEARKRLGISTGLIARWIKEGILPTTESPYNKRAKLVRRSDVERLASEPRSRARKKVA